MGVRRSGAQGRRVIDVSRLDKAQRDVLRMALVTEADRLRRIEVKSHNEAAIADAKWRRFVLAGMLIDLGTE